MSDEIFSRTCSEPATAKEVPRSPSIIVRTVTQVYRPFVRFPGSLDATCPGSDGRVAASVGMEDCERIRGAWFAADCDQHAAPPHQRVENASVVRLKSDASHGAGNADSGQIS